MDNEQVQQQDEQVQQPPGSISIGNPFFLINAITSQRNSALDTAAFWRARSDELGQALQLLGEEMKELKTTLEEEPES